MRFLLTCLPPGRLLNGCRSSYLSGDGDLGGGGGALWYRDDDGPADEGSVRVGTYRMPVGDDRLLCAFCLFNVLRIAAGSTREFISCRGGFEI